MGVLGFVSYTASHIFMDAFVYRHNRQGGLAWRTVNWDNWNVGDVSTELPAAPMTEFYMGLGEGANVLARLLSMTDVPQVPHIDWRSSATH